MANAKKCDRCEKCFDPLHMSGMMCRFKNPFFQNSNDIREGVIGKFMLSDPDAYVDLCPECAEMFEAFMCFSDLDSKSETIYRKMKAEKAEGSKDEEDMGSDTDGDDIYLPDLRKYLRGIWKDIVCNGEQPERTDETE